MATCSASFSDSVAARRCTGRSAFKTAMSFAHVVFSSMNEMPLLAPLAARSIAAWARSQARVTEPITKPAARSSALTSFSFALSLTGSLVSFTSLM